MENEIWAKHDDNCEEADGFLLGFGEEVEHPNTSSNGEHIDDRDDDLDSSVRKFHWLRF